MAERLARMNAHGFNGRLWDMDGSGNYNTAESVLRIQAYTLLNNIDL